MNAGVGALEVYWKSKFDIRTFAPTTSNTSGSSAMDQTSTPSYEFEGFRLDTVLQVLSSPTGEPIALPFRAFETLRYLVERSGEIVEKSSLMKAVWPRTVVEENNLNQCIFTLRKVLGEAAGERRFILTVPGRGFKFVAPVNVIPNSGHESHAHADPSVRQPVPAPTEPIAAIPTAMPAPTRNNHPYREVRGSVLYPPRR
jgi:DNA-binding winged helix-turn-helix (wHTH) protein